MTTQAPTKVTQVPVRAWYETPRANRLLIQIAQSATEVQTVGQEDEQILPRWIIENLSDLPDALEAAWMSIWEKVDGTPLCAEMRMGFRPMDAINIVRHGEPVNFLDADEIPDSLLAIYREHGAARSERLAA